MDLAHHWLRLAAQIEAICPTLPIVAERGATTAWPPGPGRRATEVRAKLGARL